MFDRGSGFYDDSFYLKIQGGGRIFYTLDGSEPDENSSRYIFPIKIADASSNPNVYSMLEETAPHLIEEFSEIYGIQNSHNYFFALPASEVDKATVVRAVRIDGKGNKSEVINAVYYVGMQEKSGYDNIRVVSIISDPDSLFNEDHGIYMIGSSVLERARELLADPDVIVTRSDFQDANYMQKGKKYRVPALIYLFDEEKNLTQIKNCRIAIQGHTSRQMPKKSFNVYCENGDTMEYLGYEFKSLNLCSGSQDLDSMTMDLMLNELVSDLNVASRHYTPCQLFIDGEYWGMYDMTERFDETFFTNYYGIDEDDIVMLKRTRGTQEVELGKKSDIALYHEVEEFAVSHDLTRQEYFDALFEMIDYDSFLDYYAIQLYLDHQDWPDDNFGMFRSRKGGGTGYNDGKFRYVIYDMNLVANGYYDTDIMEGVLEKDPIFAALWKNESFRQTINERIEYMADNVFHPDITDAFMDKLKEGQCDAMMKEYARQYGNKRTIKDYRRRCDKLKTFLYYRYRYVKGTVGEIKM